MSPPRELALGLARAKVALEAEAASLVLGAVLRDAILDAPEPPSQDELRVWLAPGNYVAGGRAGPTVHQGAHLLDFGED